MIWTREHGRPKVCTVTKLWGISKSYTWTHVYKIRNPSKISNSESWTTSETNSCLLQVKASGAYQACCSLPEQRSELRKAVTQLWGNSDPLPHCPDATLTQTLIDSYQAACYIRLNLIFLKNFFEISHTLSKSGPPIKPVVDLILNSAWIEDMLMMQHCNKCCDAIFSGSIILGHWLHHFFF